MITVDLPGTGAADWRDWQTPLRQFTAASGLVTALYDTAGTRQLGPHTGPGLTAVLAGSTLWHADGPGTAFERQLVAATCAGGHAMAARYGDSLHVYTQPLLVRGAVYGVLVFGWRLCDFSSALACDVLARQIGLPGHLLWSAARLDAPVSAQRMRTYADLLATLSGALDRQRETIDDLQRVNRSRDLFLAAVSHDMRTPLAALAMRIEVLLGTVPDLPPKVASGLAAMRVHVRQEAGMVDDLIDAARTLTGQMSITPSTIVLGQVVREALSTVEAQALARQLALHVTPADHGDALLLQADGKRLQQVLWNLLYNAVKFTPEGGAVHLAIRHAARWVDIDVSDTGQGIDADDLPHVFGAFNLQQHNNASGLGLGLYIARRIVELHQGTLTVRSAGRGLGTTFAIRLPLATPVAARPTADPAAT